MIAFSRLAPASSPFKIRAAARRASSRVETIDAFQFVADLSLRSSSSVTAPHGRPSRRPPRPIGIGPAGYQEDDPAGIRTQVSGSRQSLRFDATTSAGL